MGGLITSAPQAPMAAAAPQPQAAPNAGALPSGAENPGSTLQNPTLNQIEVEVEQAIRPQDLRTYKAIMVSAMKLAFDEKMHPKLIEGLKSSPDVAKNISLIVAGMLGMVWEQSKTDPNVYLPAAMPAAVNMMCQIMEFAEQSGMVQATPELIAKCAAATTKATLTKFGITDDQIKQAVDAGREANPQAEEQPEAM